MAEANPNRPGGQGPGTFMGRGGAVKSRPKGDSLLPQKPGKFLAITRWQEGDRSRLMLPGEYPKPQLPKAADAAQQLPMLPAEDGIHPRHADQIQPRSQARDAGNIHRSRLQPVRQILRHGLTEGGASRSPLDQRLGPAGTQQ